MFAGDSRFPRNLGLALLMVALVLLPLGLGERPFELRMLTVIFLYAVLGHGWNVLGGYAGQTSIGHGVFLGIGAYTSTLLVLKLGLSPWLGMLAGGTTAALVGVLIGIPCFRLKGHYFVIATLVVAESASQLFAAWEWIGGALGLQLPILPEGYASLQFHRNKAGYYYIALALLVAATGVVWWLQRSRFGFVLQAMRDDEEAVRSLGFSPVAYKLAAMAMSAQRPISISNWKRWAMGTSTRPNHILLRTAVPVISVR